MNIFQSIISVVQGNQMAQAALVAAPATALTYMARSVPMNVYHGLKRLVSIDVRLNSDMPEYESLARWITATVVRDKFSRNYVYEAEKKWDDEDYTSEVKHHGLTAGYGRHFGMFGRQPVVVNRFLDESSATDKFKEHLVVTFFTGRKSVRKFSAEIAKVAGISTEEFTSVPIHINNGGYWNRMGKRPLRRLNSVFTAGDAGLKVVEAIRAFEGKRDDNHRLGLPHHMGIMLHGEPGCGKSSLIHAVASETERSIFYLNMGSVKNDTDLTTLLSGTRDWSRIILAIEDIDAAGVKVKRSPEPTEEPEEVDLETGEPRSPVSLSALLNVLDGILCPDGLVVIATTNHLDKLDPALKREGRFDHTIELGKLSRWDFIRMADLFGLHPQAHDFGHVEFPMTGAAMRAMILKEAA